MSAIFFDTNVLVYMFDADAKQKQAQAQHLFEESTRDGRFLISTQVLQEFYVTATRKLAVPLVSADSRLSPPQRPVLGDRLDIVLLEGNLCASFGSFQQ